MGVRALAGLGSQGSDGLGSKSGRGNLNTCSPMQRKLSICMFTTRQVRVETKEERGLDNLINPQ